MKKLLALAVGLALLSAAACFAAVIDVTDKTYNDEVVKSDKPVLLEFWRPNCYYCVKMKPAMDSLSEELKDSVKVVRMNVLENKETPKDFDFTGVPAFFYLKDGKVVGSTLGFMSKDELKKDLGIK